MIIYPAIDLRQGRCVRLRQGDPNAETVFGDDPAAVARRWAAQGAEWLHVVNLDGALGATRRQIGLLHAAPSVHVQRPGGSEPVVASTSVLESLPINLQRLHEIRQAVSVPIQFGGGLRTAEDIRLALELGADRVVLGTVAIQQPQLVSEALARWGAERIVVSLDARDGKVATHGWQSSSDLELVEAGHRMSALGVKRVLYTDIGRDGMLSGVDVEGTAQLGDVTGLRVIASGGVASIEDIERLKEKEHFNVDGVIVGQALYTGRLELAQAIEVGRRPLVRQSAGVVPMRRSDEGAQFLLLYNCFFDKWLFPRGKVRSGESEETAARRVLTHETGLQVAALHTHCCSTVNYTCTVRTYAIEHTVRYFLAEPTAGEVTLGHENYSEARWLSAAEAWELLAATGPEQLPALDAAVAWAG